MSRGRVAITWERRPGAGRVSDLCVIANKIKYCKRLQAALSRANSCAGGGGCGGKQGRSPFPHSALFNPPPPTPVGRARCGVRRTSPLSPAPRTCGHQKAPSKVDQRHVHAKVGNRHSHSIFSPNNMLHSRKPVNYGNPTVF